MQYSVDKLTPETIASKWNDVTQFEKGAGHPESNQEMMEIIMTNLEQVKEERAKAATSAPAVPSTGLMSEKIFSMMKEFLNRGEGKHLIPKVKSILGFEITKKKGAKPSLIYTIDLKNGQGDVK